MILDRNLFVMVVQITDTVNIEIWFIPRNANASELRI